MAAITHAARLAIRASLVASASGRLRWLWPAVPRRWSLLWSRRSGLHRRVKTAMAIIAATGVVGRPLLVRTIASPGRMRPRSTVSAVISAWAIRSSVADQSGAGGVDEVSMLGLWVLIACRPFSGALRLLPRPCLSVVL